MVVVGYDSSPIEGTTTTTIPYDPTTTTNPTTTTDPTTTTVPVTLPFTGFGEVAWWTALAVTLLLGGSLVVLSITRRE